VKKKNSLVGREEKDKFFLESSGKGLRFLPGIISRKGKQFLMTRKAMQTGRVDSLSRTSKGAGAFFCGREGGG